MQHSYAAFSLVKSTCAQTHISISKKCWNSRIGMSYCTISSHQPHSKDIRHHQQTPSIRQYAQYHTGAPTRPASMVRFKLLFSLHTTLLSAGAIRCEYLPDGGVQWLWVKPWTPSIGRCNRHCTGASAWPSKQVASEVHSFVVNNFVIDQLTIAC